MSEYIGNAIHNVTMHLSKIYKEKGRLSHYEQKKHQMA